MIRNILLSAALVLSAQTMAAEKSVTRLETAAEAFMNYFTKTKTPDPATTAPLADEVEAAGVEVQADGAVDAAIKAQAYQLVRIILIYSLSVDGATYLPRLKAVCQKSIQDFPGSETAAGSDSVLIQLDMGGLDLKAFLARLKTFATAYPKDEEYGPSLVVMYSEYYSFVDVSIAKGCLAEGRKLYPNSGDIEDLELRVTEIGTAADLSGKTLAGADFKIQDLKGKVVLIDFWATWCGPCVAMTPELVKLYADHKTDGLEIVSYSMDRDEAALRKYVADNALPWTQLYETDRASRSAVATKFNLTAIPLLLLVDRTGNIATIGTHRLPLMKAAIEQALKK